MLDALSQHPLLANPWLPKEVLEHKLGLCSKDLSTMDEENRWLSNIHPRLALFQIWKLWFKFLPCLEISHVSLGKSLHVYEAVTMAVLSPLSERLQVHSEGWAAMARGHRDAQERYGSTSTDSRDQETHIFQVRLNKETQPQGSLAENQSPGCSHQTG